MLGVEIESRNRKRMQERNYVIRLIKITETTSQVRDRRGSDLCERPFERGREKGRLNNTFSSLDHILSEGRTSAMSRCFCQDSQDEGELSQVPRQPPNSLTPFDCRLFSRMYKGSRSFVSKPQCLFLIPASRGRLCWEIVVILGTRTERMKKTSELSWS